MVAFADRVRETTLTTGTGTITLSGVAPTQYQRFQDAFPGGAQVYYVISGNSSDATNEWEVGIGTFTAPTTLTRDTVLSSSNGGAKVNFSAATKDVFLDFPVEGVWPPANVNVNVSAGAASNNLGSVVFSNGNNVSFGLAGSTITASASVASTQGSINISGGASSANVSAFTFSNANNVSFGFDKTNVTASVTVASTQGSITVSGGASSAAISAITFSNANGVTFGFDKTNISASVNSTSAVGLNTALTANGVSWTVNSSGISLNVPAFLTTADLSQNSSKYAGINGAITGGSITVNTSGVSVNLPAYLTTADLSQNSSTYFQKWSLLGNVAGTTTTQSLSILQLSGGQGITLSGNSNTIVFSVGSYITTAMQSNAATISNINISAGASSTNVSAVTFSNANGVTFGYDKTNITASINSTSAIGLNTAQTNVTWTVNSSGLSLNAAGYAGTVTGATNASLTVNSGGVSVSVAAPGGGVTLSSYQNMFYINTTSVGITNTNGSFAEPFIIPQYGSFSYLRMLVSQSTTRVSNYTSGVAFSSGGAFAYSTWNAVVYSALTGASSQSFGSVASGSLGMTVQNSYSFNTANSAWSVSQLLSAGAYGNNTLTASTQYSQTSASLNWSTGIFTNYSGMRFVDIPFANSLTPGAYALIVGLSISSTTSGQVNANITANGMFYTANMFCTVGNQNANAYGDIATATGFSFCGATFSTAGGGTTASFANSNLSSVNSGYMIPFQLLRSA